MRRVAEEGKKMLEIITLNNNCYLYKSDRAVKFSDSFVGFFSFHKVI